MGAREEVSEAVAEVTAESADEARWMAQRRLRLAYPGLREEEVSYESEEEEDAGVSVRARADLDAWRERDSALPDEPAERVRAVLEQILLALDLRATLEVRESEEEIHAAVSGPDLGLLIGRHGQTIDAVQLLCFQSAFAGRPDRKRVTVDAEGYRERRRAVLERKADQAAERAVTAGRPVALEPMGAAERRVVHERLRERAGVETWSEGAEPERRLVVAPLVHDQPGP